LSAAFYQSGPPINGGSYDASAVAVNYGSGMSGNGYKAQMNWNCSQACSEKRDADGKGLNYLNCSQHCGAYHNLVNTTRDMIRRRCYLAGDGNCADDAGSTYNAFTEEEIVNFSGFIEGLEPSVARTSSPTSPASENIGLDGGYNVNLRTANPIYAGGMVHELSIGPMRSICSGNKAFTTEGGNGLEHDEPYEAVVWVGSSSNNSRPWEMLYCAHRHRQTDLFERVGSTTPLVINGGMPF
ncbi:MAG: hypothetical protein AAB425_04715, partial [Bdellovibrionota bacterium]